MQRQQTLHNFARFWALFSRLPYRNDEMRRAMVAEVTDGQTDDLKLLTPAEYAALCHHLEQLTGHAAAPQPSQQQQLTKKLRSGVLKRLQQLGVNTSDWAEVDRFTLVPRIAGKRFAHLTEGELRMLIRKLEAIKAHWVEPPPKERVRVRISSSTTSVKN